MQSRQAKDPFLAMFDEAFRHHQSGRLREAETLYRKILAASPRHALSLHMLGMMALSADNLAAAAELVEKAIAEQPVFHLFHNTLGNVLKAQDKTDDALKSYKKAANLKPDYAEALNNAAIILKAQGKYKDAIKFCEKALAADSGNILLLANLGILYKLAEQSEKAGESFKKVLQLNPRHRDALLNLGLIAMDRGEYDEAENYFKQILSVRNDTDARGNLGLVYHLTGRLQDSIHQYRELLKITPDSYECLNNLGTVSNELKQYDEALEYHKKALALGPDKRQTYNNLAGVYKNMGRLEEALEHYRKALALSPDHPVTYSNMLLAMIYTASVTDEEFTRAARDFGENVADPLMHRRPFKNDKNPDRKLRIGYLSPDFRDHPVRYFFEFLPKLHNREQFEIFAYSNTMREDAVTERIKAAVDHWRDIRYIDDDAAADMIEADAIDILVDPAGHTKDNCLMVFARKPAPIQVTWLGYPGTSGMRAMDYRLSDNYAEPPGMTEHLDTETLWRLPHMFCCYQPHEKSPDVIDHPPFEDNGHITFGCFNNFSKVTDLILKAWMQIMEQVPDSRLLLEIAGIDNPKHRAETESRLQRIGLPMERVILEAQKKSNQFVLYNRIDIALDPFPCVGGTTSTDTLWMGVPFVTLAGKSCRSRVGVTVLTNAGLPELIARDTESYIKIAVDLAQDRERLKKLRHNLRGRVATSPVMNQELFVRDLENAYREMWRIYCK